MGRDIDNCPLLGWPRWNFGENRLLWILIPPAEVNALPDRCKWRWHGRFIKQFFSGFGGNWYRFHFGLISRIYVGIRWMGGMVDFTLRLINGCFTNSDSEFNDGIVIMIVDRGVITRWSYVCWYLAVMLSSMYRYDLGEFGFWWLERCWRDRGVIKCSFDQRW